MNVSHHSNALLAPCLRVAPLTPGRQRRESLSILSSTNDDNNSGSEDIPVKIRHILRKSHSYDGAPQIPSRNGSISSNGDRIRSSSSGNVIGVGDANAGCSSSSSRPYTSRKSSRYSVTESRWSDSCHVVINEIPQRKFSFPSRESNNTSSPVIVPPLRRSLTKKISNRQRSTMTTTTTTTTTTSTKRTDYIPEVIHIPSVVCYDEEDWSDIEQ